MVFQFFNMLKLDLNFLIEYNEFEPRLKSAKKTVSIERRVKSWNIKYNFEWNHPYLSRVSNLSRGLNSLNSTSGLFI